MIKKGKN